METHTMFGGLTRTSLPDSIVQRFKELVASGTLKPGQRLPPIRDLAEEFGVGISSMREALTALTALGVIEVRVGEGTYIRADLSESILLPLSWSLILTQGRLGDLLEARQLIEMYLTGLAAERAIPEEIEALRAVAQEFRTAIGNQEECLRLDIAFHLAIAKAAKNIVLRDILIRLQNILAPLILRFMSDEEGQRLASKGHENLINAIAAHDLTAAREAMDEHLLDRSLADRYLKDLQRS